MPVVRPVAEVVNADIDQASAAGALEKLIRNGASAAELDSAKQSITAALNPLVAQIRVGLNAPETEIDSQVSTAFSADPAQSREAAAHLNQLLTECNPSAADFIAANRASLRPLFAGEMWPEFEKLVQDYSFADAQEKLDLAQRSFSA